MKKRFLCTLMALILLVSLVPATALTASAASLTTSEEAVRVLKDLEGYSRTAYEDPAGSGKYSIGYGTSSKAGATITEAEANTALREELAAIEKKVNTISGLNQNKFDALVLFSYNCGTAWINGSGTFKKAVVNGTVGNDFLYAITLWSNVTVDGQSVSSSGLRNRRLVEANMYLNGVYSSTKPSNYTYVLFDGNGGTVSDSIQGYNSSSAVAIKASATLSGKTFMGWYTAAEGGAWVSSLSADVAGKTLYAHWQDNENPEASNVSYTMPASRFTSLQPLSNHSADGADWGEKLASTDTVSIVQDYIDANGSRWCRIAGSGWVKVGAQVVEDNTSTELVVTVTNSYINVRSGPAATYTKVGTVNYGDKLTITDVEIASNGALWGEFEKGWVALMYTDYDSVVEEAEKDTVEEDAVATAVVVCTNYVNVRKGAGTDNAAVGSLTNGTKVSIYEIVTVNGHEWGRISTGWFCLDYATVTLVESDSDSDKEDTEDKDETEDEVTEKAIATGSVKGTYVNVRNGAGVSYTQTGKLNYGTAVSLYEITTVIGHEWGRINKTEWVCLDYVTYTLVETKDEDNTAEQPEDDEDTASALFTGTVTGVTKTLPVCKEASVDSDKLGSVNLNDTVNITEIASGVNSNGEAAVWGKIEITVDEKAVEGWICLTNNVTLKPVNYTVISNTLNVREGAGTSYNSIDKLSKGTVVAISKLAYVNETTLWGYSELFGGWMNITSTYMERTSASGSNPSGSNGSTDDTNGTGSSTGNASGYIGTAVVSGAVQLNVRSGAGLSYGTVSSLKSGTEVKIYEVVVTDGAAWGRTDAGWICLSYVIFTSTNITGTGAKATIVNSYIGVNVRSGAGTANTLLSRIMTNSRVEIYEQTTYGGQNWGRTALGWVCMDYVLLDSDAGVDMDEILNGTTGSTGETTGSGSTTSEATALSSYAGTTKEATPVYKNAGSSATAGVELAKGQAITVYELVTVTASDNTESYWARVDEGWISASNVELAAIKQTYTVTCNSLNVRKGAGTNNDQIGKLSNGTVIEVTELEIVKASIWGYVAEQKGWVNTSATYLTLGKVSTSTGTDNSGSTGTATTPDNSSTTNPTNTILYTGKIVGTPAGTVNVRSSATTSATLMSTMKEGTAVNIYELAVGDYMAWGRTDAGWVSLVYVDLVPYNSTAVDARVVQSYSLPIYESADTGSTVVGNYDKCTVVDIYEVNGYWARTSMGWIYTYGTLLT